MSFYQFVCGTFYLSHSSPEHGSTSPVNFPTLPIVCCLLAVGPVHMFLNSGSSSTAFDYTTSSLRGGGRTLLASSKKHDGDSSFEVFLPVWSSRAFSACMWWLMSLTFLLMFSLHIRELEKDVSMQGLTYFSFIQTMYNQVPAKIGRVLAVCTWYFKYLVSSRPEHVPVF